MDCYINFVTDLQPREAVGERCELMHLVNMLDIEIDLGDVLPVEEVEDWLVKLGK